MPDLYGYSNAEADGYVTVDGAIAVLNAVHRADPTVLPALIRYRVPCNEGVANHPTVQVRGDAGEALVGLLGILNGIFGLMPNGSGFMAACYDDHGELTHFENLVQTVYPEGVH
jgi:hypothetical protein